MVAALGGTAGGVERQRSGRATGRRARFGGVRTFTLLGAVAGIAGWLTTVEPTHGRAGGGADPQRFPRASYDQAWHAAWRVCGLR